MKRKALLTILLVSLILLIPTIVKATVDYTRTITGNDGSITINLTGITLDTSKQYEFALVSTGGTPSIWHLITNYTESTAKIELNSTTTDIVNVLKITDNGEIFIREKDNETEYIMEKMSVDLKLPYLQAVNYTKEYDWYTIGKTYGIIGGGLTSKNTYYKLEKISDETFISTFINNNKQTDAIENLLPTPPTTGFTQDGYFTVEEDDGLYIIWIQIKGEGTKTITGAIIHDGLPDATTLKEYIPTTPTGDEQEEPDNTEKIDTTSYVSFPIIIFNGKSSLSVKNYKGDYSLYYQFVETTDEIYSEIEQLGKDYKDGKITYEKYFTSYKETATKYDDTKWINTSDGNFEKDISEFEGTKRFVLWAKLEMSDKTSYECMIYTLSGNVSTNVSDETQKITEQQVNKENEDKTITTKVIPDTGKTLFMWIIAIIVSLSTIGYIRYKKLNKIV